MDFEKEPSMSDKFLSSVDRIIEENLGNENFSVDELSSQAGISRSMLHRRLKRLTGKSASDLISEKRLNRAKELLENNVATVSEIAYRVGFNSPSYFNKVFQKYYGVPPGEVRKGTMISTGDLVVDNLRHKIKKRFIWIAVIVLTLLTIGSGVYFIKANKSIETSIAVLPLDDLTGQPDNAYFVEGMHDALINELGQIASIRVISRTSTLRYKESGMLLKDIATDLGVTNIVEGSIFSAGDSLRMIVQLIEVFPKERHLWAHEYHNQMGKVLSVQASAVKEIAQSIKVKLSPDESIHLASYTEINPETYKAYLRGMYYLNKGTPESFETGINYLHDAIDKDPGDPFAYAGLALGYVLIGHGPLSEEEAFLRAQAAATKAIRLDSTLDQAHTALALLNLYQTWDWEQAKNAFEQAIRTNPSNEIAHAHYAWHHVLFGNEDRAIYHAKKAIAIEPFSGSYHSWLAWIYYYFGHYEQAEQMARKSLELQENLPYGLLVLGWTYLQKGMYKEAIDLHEKLPAEGDMWKAIRGYTYLKAGMKEKSLELWEEFQAESKDHDVNPCYMGLMAGYLGFADVSFDLLNNAIEKKNYPITYVDVFPGSEYLREDFRYQALKQRMGLPYHEKDLAVN